MSRSSRRPQGALGRGPDPGERIYLGVVRVLLQIPGARSRKDRRSVVSSVRDRLQHRFDVSIHEIGTSGDPSYQTLVLTTAGNDPQLLRSVLDRCVGQIHGHPTAIAAQVDVDVFRWEVPDDGWAARMMAELGSDDGG